MSSPALFTDIKKFLVSDWRKHSVAGLLFLLTLGFNISSTANITSISATQDATDTTDPFLFSVNYTIDTPGNSNAFIHGITLEYDDGNGYQQLATARQVAFPTET